MKFSELRADLGNVLSAERYNAAVDAIERLLNVQITDAGEPPSVRHPFRVSARSIEAKIARQPVWALKVLPGIVNDRDVTIPWLAKNDPRDWDRPTDYKPRFVGPTAFERLLRESDPPFLRVTTVPTGETEDVGEKRVPVLRRWQAVHDSRREQWFQTAAEWERDLYYTFVYLVDAPFDADGRILTAADSAKRWRVTWGNPGDVPIGGPRGIIELAKVYLSCAKTGECELHIVQTTFTNLATARVDPRFDIPHFDQIESPGYIGFGGLGIEAIVATNNIMADLANQQLAIIQADAQNALRLSAILEQKRFTGHTVTNVQVWSA